MLLLSSLALTMFQLGLVSQSFGQFRGQTTQLPRPTGQPGNNGVHTGPPGYSIRGNYTRNQTQTGVPQPRWNQSWTNTGNQSWTRMENETYTYMGNQTTWTRITGPRGNETHGVGVPPGLVNGWAHSNITVGARNVTHPFFMNGTRRVTLGSIAINASSGNQVIRNVAFNRTVAQIEFDRNGSIQLIINSSVKPTQVFADSVELSEAQSLNGLTAGEAWFYDQSNHTLIILADPSSITIFYEPAASPVPEFPATPSLILILIVVLVAAATKRRLLLRHRRRRVSVIIRLQVRELLRWIIDQSCQRRTRPW